MKGNNQNILTMKLFKKHSIGVSSRLVLMMLVTFSVSNIVLSQNSDLDDEIIATGDGKRNITKSNKASVIPAFIIDSSKKQLEMDYIFYEYTAPSDFKVEEIRPAKIEIKDPLDKLYRGYLKAGIGMYLSPLVDLYYNSERTKYNNWGIHYNHFSSNTSINNTGFSGLSDNHADVFYKHFLEEYSIGGELYYDRNVNHFYGFLEEDTIIPKDSIKQRFQTIGGRVQLASYMQNIPEFNYHGEIGFRNYTDLYGARENNFVLSGGAQNIIDSELYGIEGSLDINGYKRTDFRELDDTNATFFSEDKRTTNAIFSLNPHIITNRNKLKAQVGLNIAIDIGDKSRFHFYPKAEFKYAFHDIFVPYVGVDGNLSRNSFYSLSQENPFVLTDIATKNTNTKYNIYGGIRGSFSNRLTFNVSAAKKKLVNLPLYFNDTLYSIENKFDVVYDTLDVFNVTGQLSYKLGEKINIWTRGEYNLYSGLNEQGAWNLAPVEITLGGVYDLADKIVARANIFFVSDRKAKSLTFVDGAEFTNGEYIVKLPAFVDFNLGFEYRYTKRFSVFLNFNNIVSKKYRMYHKYPVQGINILGGLTLSF